VLRRDQQVFRRSRWRVTTLQQKKRSAEIILLFVCAVSVYRTIESLYEELVSEGIIVRPSKVSLADYVGEYSFLGTTLRQANIEPMPSLTDVRRLVTEYTILPLGRGPVACCLLKFYEAT